MEWYLNNLGGQRIAVRQGSTLTYLHADALGSASLATSVTGTLVSQLRYLPYGETRPDFAASAFPTDRRFTGQRAEVTLGLYDYGARMYDVSLGRFISADSIVPEAGNPQSLNRYMYTIGNPLKYTDPSGHFALLATAALGGLIGGVVSVGYQALPVLIGGGTLQEACQAVDPVKVLGAAAGGAVFGLTMGVGTALLGTGLVATTVSGAAAGVVSGQAGIVVEAATTEVLRNPLTPQAWDGAHVLQTAQAKGLGDWRTMTIDAGGGAIAGVMGHGANRLAQSIGLIPTPPSGLGKTTYDVLFNTKGIPYLASDAIIKPEMTFTVKVATGVWTVVRGTLEEISGIEVKKVLHAVAQ